MVFLDIFRIILTKGFFQDNACRRLSSGVAPTNNFSSLSFVFSFISFAVSIVELFFPLIFNFSPFNYA